MEFEWDPEKEKANRRKHGLSFGVAVRAFLDPDRRERLDERSVDEERWNMIGLVNGHEIVVTYTLRSDVIRLISARGADKDEREEYWSGSI